MGYFANARPADSEGYLNGLADIFETYPLGVVQECCHIKRGVASSCGNFLPSPQQVINWCESRVGACKYIIKLGAPKPEVEYSKEHRASMRERITALFANLKQTPDRPAYAGAAPFTDDQLRAHYTVQQTQPAREAAE